MKPQDTVNIQNQFRVTTRGHTVKLKNHVCNSIKNHNMPGGDKVCAQTLECGGSVERSRVHRLEHLEPSVVFFNLLFREGGDTGRDTSIRCLLYTLQLRTEPHNPGTCPNQESVGYLSLCRTTPSQPSSAGQGCSRLLRPCYRLTVVSPPHDCIWR